MRIGEVSLNTNDVIRLADFYKQLLGIDNGSDDPWHQVLLEGEPSLTVYNDGTRRNNLNQNISLAFTVDDVEAAYLRLLDMGTEILEPPTRRPWGAINMSFRDPDGNTLYFRQFTGGDA